MQSNVVKVTVDGCGKCICNSFLHKLIFKITINPHEYIPYASALACLNCLTMVGSFPESVWQACQAGDCYPVGLPLSIFLLIIHICNAPMYCLDVYVDMNGWVVRVRLSRWTCGDVGDPAKQFCQNNIACMLCQNAFFTEGMSVGPRVAFMLVCQSLASWEAYEAA